MEHDQESKPARNLRACSSIGQPRRTGLLRATAFMITAIIMNAIFFQQVVAPKIRLAKIHREQLLASPFAAIQATNDRREKKRWVY